MVNKVTPTSVMMMRVMKVETPPPHPHLGLAMSWGRWNHSWSLAS